MAVTAQPDASIILPVFNEAGHLAEEVHRIRQAMDTSGLSYEIIVVDDGSTDGSTDLINQLTEVRVIRFANNRGSGTARRAGSAAALGRCIVWTDVDMTYPNERIPEFVKELELCDQVVGARMSESGSTRVLRVPAKWFIRRLAEFLTDTKIPDLNSGLRAFRADVARQYLHLLPNGFSCVTTITMTFLANGYSVNYLPIEYSKRAGQSKFHWRRDTQRYLTQIIRMILSYNPLRVFVPLTTVLLVTGLVKTGFDWASRDFRLATNTLLVFFAAFQFLAIGLLADLVVRVSRPTTYVEPT